MSVTGSETLDRIQQEIKENLEREEELRKKYKNVNGESETRNGYVTTPSPEPPKSPQPPLLTNGISKPTPLTNGTRRFTPNPSSRGVMHKFLKSHGKVGVSQLKPTQVQPQTAWVNDNIFEPAKVTIEPGKHIRNGFIPAEEKMRRELQEFQKREDELRKERRKSQPDLMAALEAEAAIETNLKPARSTALMYSSEDLTSENYSAPSSLKPAKSLAELCDASDEDLEMPGTHTLIMQFEKLQNQDRS